RKEMENIFENKFRYKKFKAVIHCFTGTNKFAQKMLEMGFYISASGIITFKNSSDLRSTFKKIPLNRLLVETDSPFLAPEPKRGKTNNPSFIVHTIEKLSEIFEVSYDEICYHSTNNFSKLFNKAKIDK
ncbi:MAG: TatD family hydrolase, partial [Candidatus Pelagibacterales bacterium]